VVMNNEPWKARKVIIVGAGAVGSTFAYALAQSGLADEIVLIDQNRELALGQVLDLAHGSDSLANGFAPSTTRQGVVKLDPVDSALSLRRPPFRRRLPRP